MASYKMKDGKLYQDSSPTPRPKSPYDYTASDNLRQISRPAPQSKTDYDYDPKAGLKQVIKPGVQIRSPGFLKKQGDFMKGELQMDSHRITGLAAPSDAYDAVRLGSNLFVPTENLGSGTPSASTVLCGDYSWKALSGLTIGNADMLDGHDSAEFLFATALSDSVVSETAFGQSPSAGNAVTVSRGDHTHGSPSTVFGEFAGDLPNAYLRFKTTDQEQTSQDSGLVLRTLTGTQYRKISNLYTAQVNNTLRQVVFYLSATPTNGDGYVWAELWSDDGGNPGKPNALLATSSKVHLADMDTGQGEVTFNFLRESAARVVLGTKYHLVLNGDYSLSDSATVTAYMQTAITTNQFSYYDGAAWQSYPTYTMYFKAIVGTNSQDINLTSFPTGGGRLNISNLPDSIPDRKLAQITTAGKVSGAALTGLTSVPAGAGILPTANLPANLASIAGLTYASNSFVKMTGAGTFSLDTNIYSLSSHNHSGVYQPLDATLTALADVTTAADKLIYATDADVFTTCGLTAYARTLLDDTSAGNARNTLGAYVGTWGLLVGGTGLNSVSGKTNNLLGVDSGPNGYEFKALSGTSNQVSIAHGVGTITFATPQDIHTGASPTFNQGNFTALHTTTLLADNIGEHTGAHAIVFDNDIQINNSYITGKIKIGTFNHYIGRQSVDGSMNIGGGQAYINLLNPIHVDHIGEYTPSNNIVFDNDIQINNSYITGKIKIGTFNHYIGRQSVDGSMNIGGGQAYINLLNPIHVDHIGEYTPSNNVVFDNTVNLSTLGASLPVYTDASKNLITSSTGTKILTFTRNLNAATEAGVTYYGFGFKPRGIIIMANIDANTKCMSIGFGDSALAEGNTATQWDSTWYQNSSGAYIVYIAWDSSNKQSALLASFEADGFKLDWTRTGAGGISQTIKLLVMAFR